MKSFLLSALLTVLAFVYVTQSFNRQHSFYRTAPVWLVILPLVVVLAGYLLALYWGITGMRLGHKGLNLAGIALSLLGLCYYWMGYRLQTGKGQESKGQFDHHIAAIAAGQRGVLYQLLKESGTPPSQLVMVPYWEMEKTPDGFAVCVQEGKVIGLQMKNKPLPDLSLLSRLQSLNWLVLQHAGLKSLAGLDLPALQRLNVEGNELTSLTGIESLPQLQWLNYGGNPVNDSAALKATANKDLFIVNR